jgi:hypothetical protein
MNHFNESSEKFNASIILHSKSITTSKVHHKKITSLTMKHIQKSKRSSKLHIPVAVLQQFSIY